MNRGAVMGREAAEAVVVTVALISDSPCRGVHPGRAPARFENRQAAMPLEEEEMPPCGQRAAMRDLELELEEGGEENYRSQVSSTF